MKIVLKHKQEVKLYTEELDFDHMLNFIQTQFKLSKQSLSMTFHDPEGDDITILTNQDFEIMQNILQGKEYVKINVEGTKIEGMSSNEKMITVLQDQKSKQELKNFQQDEKLKQIDRNLISPQNKVKKKQPGNELQSELKCEQNFQKEKSCKIKNLLNEMVVNLVDERIKSLLPCLKQQLKANQEYKIIAKEITKHQGVQCKSCSIRPIVGIRYKCPKCPDFNLCERCQDKIQHQHNLFKIKRIQPQEKAQQHVCIAQLFRGCSSKQGQQKRQKCRRWGSGGHHFTNKLMGLSFIFGGKPEAYSSYVKQNQNLYPRQTFGAYAKSIGMPQNIFRKKFIKWRCQKLSQFFSRPAQTYEEFVQQNYNLKFREIIELLYLKGIEKRQEKSFWKGKCFNFRDFNQQKEKFQEKNCGGVVGPMWNDKQVEQKIELSQSILKQPKPLDSPEVNRAKGRLFMQIKSLSPDEENKQIYKFVDQSYKQDNDQEVIKLWVQKCFGE